jgi:oxygen-independent coproporphyrinogen-3 oxidase
MKPEPIALYIHWPFCASRCPYCDFNAHVRDVIPQDRYRHAIRRELALEAEQVRPREVGSIFFGGGTPSLMEPETAALVLDDVRRLFPLSADLEVTLEVNPTSAEAARLAELRAAGVNRISIGVQSLDAQALAALGRRHSVGQAIRTLEIARDLFTRVSFDLIYARPGQTIAAWRAELRQALALVSDHLSLYQLTIEPGTVFEGAHRRGELVLPDEDLAAELYTVTADEAARFGLLPYEISNYARPGAESRHNLRYWRYGDYIGIGPGAHGRLTSADGVHAIRRHRAPEEWMRRVEETGSGMAERTLLSPEDTTREMLLMGLRLAEGLDIDRFRERTGRPLESAIDAEACQHAAAAGYIAFTNGRLIATEEGRRRLDALLPYLVR